MITLVLATTNLHKVRELRAMLRDPALLERLGVEVDLLNLRDFPSYVAPEETGATLKENALLKATHAAKELKLMCLSDDSGLFIPALGGAPGVRSARFAGLGATDRDHRKMLLQSMGHLQSEQRFGFYECCLALALPNGAAWTASGTCEGEILFQERGHGGFGYDPLFIRHEYNRTFGEMDETLKNRISHRRKAFDRLRPFVEQALVQEQEAQSKVPSAGRR